MQPDFTTCFPLRPARVHEVCGAASVLFAAALMTDPTLWIAERWVPEVVNPIGLHPYFDPSKLLLARTPSQIDSLAVAEEALRDGAVPFVVVAINQPLDLRAGRRLQLAAKEGNATGLCLIPEGMGSNASETRWRAQPVFDREQSESTLMRWEILKNKRGTIGHWLVRWNPRARRFEPVPEAPAAQT